jgi:hypothetical protein
VWICRFKLLLHLRNGPRTGAHQHVDGPFPHLRAGIGQGPHQSIAHRRRIRAVVHVEPAQDRDGRQARPLDRVVEQRRHRCPQRFPAAGRQLVIDKHLEGQGGRQPHLVGVIIQ